MTTAVGRTGNRLSRACTTPPSGSRSTTGPSASFPKERAPRTASCCPSSAAASTWRAKPVRPSVDCELCVFSLSSHPEVLGPGVPIGPVSIEGAHELYSPASYSFHPDAGTVRYGPSAPRSHELSVTHLHPLCAGSACFPLSSARRATLSTRWRRRCLICLSKK